MLRTRHRLSALTLALVFVFAGTAEGMGVHRCPHHDVLPGAAPDAAMQAGHDHVAAGHAHGADSGASDHDSCTCMGACQPAGVATPPSGGSSAFTLDSADGHAFAWPTSPPARAALVPFVLPFANAPPSL